MPFLANQSNPFPPATLSWGGGRVSFCLSLWRKSNDLRLSGLLPSAAPACSGGTISLPEAGWHPSNHSHADPAALSQCILSCPGHPEIQYTLVQRGKTTQQLSANQEVSSKNSTSSWKINPLGFHGTARSLWCLQHWDPSDPGCSTGSLAGYDLTVRGDSAV